MSERVPVPSGVRGPAAPMLSRQASLRSLHSPSAHNSQPLAIRSPTTVRDRRSEVCGPDTTASCLLGTAGRREEHGTRASDPVSRLGRGGGRRAGTHPTGLSCHHRASASASAMPGAPCRSSRLMATPPPAAARRRRPNVRPALAHGRPDRSRRSWPRHQENGRVPDR